jgi:hypothetical protein
LQTSKRAWIKKEFGDGGLKWEKKKGALKPFRLLWNLGVLDYYQAQALLSVADLCMMHIRT